MSIATEIQRIQQAKADIKTAINNKGGTLSDTATIDTFASAINNLNTSNSTSEPLGFEAPKNLPVASINDFSVSFPDYNVVLIKEYVGSEGIINFALPEPSAWGSQYTIGVIGNGGDCLFNQKYNPIENLVIPEGYVEISPNAFAFWTDWPLEYYPTYEGIKYIWLPSTLDTIDSKAFDSCFFHTDFILYIPLSVRVISYNIFKSCSVVGSSSSSIKIFCERLQGNSNNGVNPITYVWDPDWAITNSNTQLDIYWNVPRNYKNSNTLFLNETSLTQDSYEQEILFTLPDITPCDITSIYACIYFSDTSHDFHEVANYTWINLCLPIEKKDNGNTIITNTPFWLEQPTASTCWLGYPNSGSASYQFHSDTQPMVKLEYIDDASGNGDSLGSRTVVHLHGNPESCPLYYEQIAWAQIIVSLKNSI